jgi:hypothetical protein
MSLRINGSVLGKRNVPTLSLATGTWNMRAQALYKRDNLWPLAYDPDAAAYFEAVATAGGTVSDAQKTAIDTFYRTGKSDGWYSSLKRLYLPIWAAAAPNAIDMIALGSGTFAGTVTHGAGYVQSDGSTGYFDTATKPADIGMTTASAFYGALLLTAAGSNHHYIGASQGITQLMTLRHDATNIATDFCNTSTARDTTASARDGIICASRNGGVMAHYRRSSSGFVTAGSYTRADAGTLPDLVLWVLGRNTNGSLSFSDTSQIGSNWLAVGATSAQVEAFTLALKDLWETVTGLTLP